jgi:predicted ATPase
MGVPYQPFVEALGRYVREAPAPALGRLAGELVRLVPEVASRVPGLPPPLRSDPETERYRLFDALAAWLAAASESAPVLLVVDDLHWATTPTLQLLRHLVRSGESLRLLAVVAYRDTAMDVTGDLADTVAELLREPGVERLGLSGLDEAGVAAFMEARAGHELDDEARAFAAMLHAETAGNPFFVGEVLAHLTEHGAIALREGRWDTERPLAEMTVPEGVAEVVRRRLARLPEETNEVLSVAAVLGERFELPVLVEAGGMPEIATMRAVDPALAARLVREVGELIGSASEARQRLATFAIDTEIRFASAAERAKFAEELSTAVTRLAGKYHQGTAETGRAHRLVIALHPSITKSTDSTKEH